MEEKEIWMDIKGYEGMYQVSNLGRVKSLPRLVQKWDGMRMINERILKDYINQGYHKITLSRDGKKKHFSIHRIVYENFVGEIPEGMQVNHISEDKSDNRLSNLNLMTPKENCNYGTRNERHSKKIIMDNEIEFDSMAQAANYLGCSKGIISRCCIKPTYTVFGHHFKYKEESK